MREIIHDLRDTLDGKEPEIYRLLCRNLSNHQISSQISMPVPTVKWHLRNIYRKLGTESRGDSDKNSARRRAMFYSGTRIEQVVSFTGKTEKFFTLKDIRNAAKKIGLSMQETEDLISFLEMDLE